MKTLIKILFTLLLFSTLTLGQSSYGSDLSGTVAIPTGVNSDYFNTGFGGIGGFYYEMDSNWRIGLTLGFIISTVDGDAVNNYFQSNQQGASVNLDGSVSTIPILLSFKYVAPGESVRFYGIIEAGLYVYWTNLNGSIIYPGDVGTAPVDQSEFSSEPGFDLGLGALYPVSPEISIDFNIRYHFVRNSGTIKVKYDYDNQGIPYASEETVGSSHFLNIGIGANWNFDL